jgi:chromosome segregation ATPase
VSEPELKTSAEALRRHAARIAKYDDPDTATALRWAASDIDTLRARIADLDAECVHSLSVVAESYARAEAAEARIAEQVERALSAERRVSECMRRIAELEANAGKIQLQANFSEYRVEELEHESETLLSRIAELEKALEPFADVDGEGDEDFPDSTKVVVTFGRTTYYAGSLGDFRRARALLRSHKDAGQS